MIKLVRLAMTSVVGVSVSLKEVVLLVLSASKRGTNFPGPSYFKKWYEKVNISWKFFASYLYTECRSITFRNITWSILHWCRMGISFCNQTFQPANCEIRMFKPLVMSENMVMKPGKTINGVDMSTLATDYVDTKTAQTINGHKTFNNNITSSNIIANGDTGCPKSSCTFSRNCKTIINRFLTTQKFRKYIYIYAVYSW